MPKPTTPTDTDVAYGALTNPQLPPGFKPDPSSPKNTLSPQYPWPHPDFNKNSQAYPVEELWKHINQHIAWSWDGTRIVAAGETIEALCLRLDEMGVDPSNVVFDFVDDPNVSRIGCL